ncbi:AAA family ATPase [Vibrio splendidus]
MRENTSKYYNGAYCSAIIGKNGVGKTTILDFIENFLINSDPIGIMIFFQEEFGEFYILDPYHLIKKVYSEHKYTISTNTRQFAKYHSINILKVNNLSNIEKVLTHRKENRSVLTSNKSISRLNNANKKQKSEHFHKISNFLYGSNSVDKIGKSKIGYMIEVKQPAIYGVLKKPISEITLDTYDEKELEEYNYRYDASKEKDVIENQDFPRSSYDLSIIDSWKEKSIHEYQDILYNPEHLCNHFLIPIILFTVNESNFEKSAHIRLSSMVIEEYMTSFIKIDEPPYDHHSSIELIKNSFHFAINKALSIKLITEDRSFDIEHNLYNLYKKLDSITNIARDNKSSNFQSTPDNKIAISDYDNLTNAIETIESLPKQISSYITFGWEGISSGEMAKINIFSEIYAHINNQHIESSIIIIDEADLYLHPEWQRTFLYELISLMTKNCKHRMNQIILTSHSPIIISDFLPNDIVSLDKDSNDNTYVKKSLGFGTNISNLFIDEMHISSTFGEHSRIKIEGLLSRFEAGKKLDGDDFLISQIGNKHMREYLQNND